MHYRCWFVGHMLTWHECTHAQEFVGMLALKPNERVLDVGCGIGAPHACQNRHQVMLM